MATYSTPEPFQKKVYPLMVEVAKYAYNNGDCGLTAARAFQKSLNDALTKCASAPLQNSSDWGNPQRRAFFQFKGQYTLIFIFKPFDANSNTTVQKIIFSDIYPSRSVKGNTPHPDDKTFDADELL